MNLHIYDIVVIGAGAAGMMAAGEAASHGAKVLLLEKMERPGRKLLITGKGRCNITNTAEFRDFISHFKPNENYIKHVFGQFFNTDLISFFNEHGVDTDEERGGRVFPTSDSSHDVADALILWLRKNKVDIWTKAAVDRFISEDAQLKAVKLYDGRQIFAQSFILATGGASYPATGSTGDGYKMVKPLGHHVTEIYPALVPLHTEGNTAKQLEGLSLRNINARILLDKKVLFEEFGEMLFTAKGVSGPVILSLSRNVVPLIHQNLELSLSIDLKPAVDETTLENRIRKELDENGKMYFHNFLKFYLPQKLIDVCSKLIDIPHNKPCSQISAVERKRFRVWLKNFNLNITGHGEFKEAIITKGGISVNEVDFKTMQSKKISNLFIAGEVLDIDAETGGYNLQAAFSTGIVAGRSAALMLIKNME
jgi:predicted Rossmann fold flavoprotein